MVTLRQALLSCPTGLLNKMAREYALRVDATTLRPELVAALRDTIGERAAYAQFWESLATVERAAVGIVARTERGVEADTLLRRIAAEIQSGTRLGSTEPKIDTVDVTSLLDRGLLYRMFNTDGPARGTFLVMPDELRVQANRYLGAASPLAALAVAATPMDVRRVDPAYDVFALASLLRREAWTAAARGMGGQPDRGLDRVLARLPSAAEPDDAQRRRVRWRFLVALGRRDGWLRGDGVPSPDDERVAGILAQPGRAIEVLWRAYLGAPPTKATRLPPSVEDGLIGALNEAPDDAWFDASTLASELARSARSASAEPAGANAGAAQSVDATPIEDLLLTAWYWLGLVRRGRADDGRTLVAPTVELARVGGRVQVAAAAPSPCALADDLTLVAPRDADLAALYEVEPFLALDRTVPDRRYRLTPGSFSRGVRLGGTPDALLALLARLIDGPVPPGWEAAVLGWQSQGRSIRVAARIVLEVDRGQDLARVEEALGDDRTGVERLSPRHLAIAADALGDVLRKLGDAALAVEVAPELRLDPRRPERAAALGPDGSDTVRVLLEALRRLDPSVVSRDPALASLSASLDSVTPVSGRQAIERRAAALVARITERRAKRPRKP